MPGPAFVVGVGGLGLTVRNFSVQSRALATPTKSRRIEIRLSEAEQDATRFLEALDHPERFQPHLSWLSEPPSILPG